MILPDKSITLSYSLVGIGSYILNELATSQTISSLWERVKNHEEITTFEKFVLSLDFLYAIGLIDFKDGIVRRNKYDSDNS
jgi:hypothetical protein